MSVNLKAALLIMLAMTFISCNDAIMKTVMVSLSIGQALFIRGLIISCLLLIVLKIKKLPLLPKKVLSKSNLSRGLCEMSATVCFVTSLSLMPLATASTLTWTTPIISTVLAAIILKENVVPLRWAAVFVGFIGIVLVSNPFSGSFSPVVFLPLMAALLVSSRDILTRKISPDIHSLHITLVTVILVTFAGLLLSIFNWRPVEMSNIFALACSAVLLGLGFFTQITAIRMGELSFIAPFSYFGIIVAVILGIVFWSQYPTVLMLGGIVLIICSGILISLGQVKYRISRT